MISLKINDSNSLASYLLVTISFLLPGISYLYITNPDLFLSIDVIKLLLLVISYSTPLVLMIALLWTRLITTMAKRTNVILLDNSFYLITATNVILFYSSSVIIMYIMNLSPKHLDVLIIILFWLITGIMTLIHFLWKLIPKTLND